LWATFTLMRRFNMTSSSTLELVELALGYTSSQSCFAAPRIDFALASELQALGAHVVPEARRPHVVSQVLDAFSWCSDRFPLGLRESPDSVIWAIQTLSIGHSAHEGEYLTASSPQRPYTVFVAATWPIHNRHRLASLFAHEAMHQGLYIRERNEAPTRRHSLAYSPWKQGLRPGRLVWHAFWTFSVQFVFLGQAVLEAFDEISSSDADISSFLAEMQARIELCAQSLDEFDVLRREERSRCEQGMHIVSSTTNQLRKITAYEESCLHWAAAANQEVEVWAANQAMFSSARPDTGAGVAVAGF
jgi:hypothetical protein